MQSEKHPRESDRLALLSRLNILDTEAEQIYDDFVHLAATICNTPVALVSLVAQERQCFKAKVGIDITETPRAVSFCSHAILDTNALVVADATLDARFADNPLVTGEFHLRFYVGIPILVEGLPIGTLCVIDTEPKEISPAQLRSLESLGRQLTAILESRLSQIRLAEATEKLERTEATLVNAKLRFEELFLNLAVASYTTDCHGTIYEFNRQAEELFGRQAFEMMGRTDVDTLVSAENQEIALQVRSLVAAGESIYDKELKVLGADGKSVTVLYNSHPVKGHDGSVVGAIHVLLDIEARKTLENDLILANRSLEQLAKTDGLTQISNRMAVMEVLEREFRSVPRNPVSVILIDVDKFKSYNDTFGHPAGDEVLRKVASLLSTASRPSDTAGRYGGEEFIVILPNTKLDVASQVAERLRSAIELYDWPLRGITISLGVASSESEAGSFEKLVSLADVRLYAAKSGGRNRVVSDTAPLDVAA